MSGPLGKILLLIIMTHGFRGLGRLAGPRRSGLMLGLPCTTAIALFGCAQDRGIAEGLKMAEASLLGLAAAAALPLAYARAVGLGWRLPGSIGAAVAGYGLVAGGFGLMPAAGGVGSLVASMAAVLVACRLARAMAGGQGGGGLSRPSRGHALALRTIVPMACLSLVLACGELAGPYGAGLLSTFPGLTLAVLVVTHLESGPAVASRMARSLPPGNLGMVAFLAAFRFAGPALGLASATACGYAGSVLTLLVVERCYPPARPDPARRRGRRNGLPARFSPRIELLAC